MNTLLQTLLTATGETEWVEFKCNNDNPQEIGEYLSAIANAAALHRKDKGYMVWGVDNASRRVVGTTFKPRRAKKGNEELESWLSRLLEPRLHFRIQESTHEGKPVVIFEVPEASSMPVRFGGEEFIRVGTSKRKLKDYPEKECALWAILRKEDWSAQICEGANFNTLLRGPSLLPGRSSKRSILPLRLMWISGTISPS